jgi:hypothetical protein
MENDHLIPTSLTTPAIVGGKYKDKIFIEVSNELELNIGDKVNITITRCD